MHRSEHEKQEYYAYVDMLFLIESLDKGLATLEKSIMTSLRAMGAKEWDLRNTSMILSTEVRKNPKLEEYVELAYLRSESTFLEDELNNLVGVQDPVHNLIYAVSAEIATKFYKVLIEDDYSPSFVIVSSNLCLNNSLDLKDLKRVIRHYSEKHDAPILIYSPQGETDIVRENWQEMLKEWNADFMMVPDFEGMRDGYLYALSPETKDRMLARDMLRRYSSVKNAIRRANYRSKKYVI